MYAVDLAEILHKSFSAYSDTTFRYSPVNVGDEESMRALAGAAAEMGEPIKGAVLAAGIAHSQPLLDRRR